MTICTIILLADYNSKTNDVVVHGIEDNCNGRSIYIRDVFDYYNEFYPKYFDTCPNFKLCPYFRAAPAEKKVDSHTKKLSKAEPKAMSISPEMQKLFEETYHPVMREFSRLMFENYGDYYDIAGTRSKTNPATGEMALSVAFKNIESESPDEMYKMIIDDLYGEEIVPNGWEIIDIGEPDIIFDKTGASMNFTIKFKAPIT